MNLAPFIFVPPVVLGHDASGPPPDGWAAILLGVWFLFGGGGGLVWLLTAKSLRLCDEPQYPIIEAVSKWCALIIGVGGIVAFFVGLIVHGIRTL